MSMNGPPIAVCSTMKAIRIHSYGGPEVLANEDAPRPTTAKAEAEHTTLFTQAAQGLERLRGEAVIYYVCPTCGFTSAKAGLSLCPICSNPGDRFEEVN
jgi:rubrerythrin